MFCFEICVDEKTNNLALQIFEIFLWVQISKLILKIKLVYHFFSYFSSNLGPVCFSGLMLKAICFQHSAICFFIFHSLNTEFFKKMAETKKPKNLAFSIQKKPTHRNPHRHLRHHRLLSIDQVPHGVDVPTGDRMPEKERPDERHLKHQVLRRPGGEPLRRAGGNG